jgi:hypothetical protein
MAPAPEWPRSWNGLIALPGQVDAYLKDHFGFRQTMVRELPFLSETSRCLSAGTGACSILAMRWCARARD